MRRSVRGQFEQPALVNLEAGLERVLFLRRQEVEMLDRPPLFQNRVPDIGAVLALFLQQLFQMRVLHHEAARQRSEEHTSELQSLMRLSYAVFCLKKNNQN